MIQLLRRQLRAEGVQNLPRDQRPSTKENPFGLTNRQMEILRLLIVAHLRWACNAEKLTNGQIAERLTISAKTVDHHVSAILAKLAVASRAEAADVARRTLNL